MRPLTFVLTGSLLALAGLAHAQERTISNPVKADSSQQNTDAAHLQTDLTTLNTQLQSNCGTHAAGTTWTDPCAASQKGAGITRECDNGQAVTLQNNCFTQNDCGSHAHDTTWAGTCPSGTSGNLTYRCSNGVTTLDSAGTNCAIPNCNGQTYGVPCPATSADGIPLTGTMTFQCVSGQQMVLTGNTCQTYARPCGGTPNGGTAVYSCAAYGARYYGNIYMGCSNSTAWITSFGCGLYY